MLKLASLRSYERCEWSRLSNEAGGEGTHFRQIVESCVNFRAANPFTRVLDAEEVGVDEILCGRRITTWGLTPSYNSCLLLKMTTEVSSSVQMLADSRR